MNIVVCIKQVPDTTEIKIDPVKNTLIRTGVPSIMNPFDKNALEQALRVKEKNGGTVTVISMGPDQAKAVLREALAMGADKAYLVTDRAFGGSDTYATSYILSQVIKKIGPFDVILGGIQAIDGDTGQTASSIAEHLGLNRVSYVLDMEKKDDKVIIKRKVEEGVVVLEAKLPVLVTSLKESNKPRYRTIKGVIDALKAEIPEIRFADLPGIDETKIGLKGSPTRVKATFTPKRNATGEVMEAVNPQETARALVGKLVEAKLL
ncbi:MAG TPA: electron transfer flavoprotein subunit beta/FixA family protein [Clostridiaceae bacterium]|nr:electron transfer flavoprotein subunit beta/FixA family protein [Clostridiaceae bacterium]